MSKVHLFIVEFMSLEISSARQDAIRTLLDFPGFLLVLVLIMSDKVILDLKKSYLVCFENFHFFRFLAKTWVKKSQKMKIFKTDQILLFSV
jgi:hypothetical protein